MLHIIIRHRASPQVQKDISLQSLNPTNDSTDYEFQLARSPGEQGPDTPESIEPTTSPLALKPAISLIPTETVTDSEQPAASANARMSAGCARSRKGDKDRKRKNNNEDGNKSKRRRSNQPKANPSGANEKTAFQIEETDMPTLWVQCEKCGKWRRLNEGKDPLQLPEKWYCHMNTDLEQNNCEKPQIEFDPDNLTENIETSFTRGSLVWAKLERFPWWPGIIDNDPDSNVFFQTIDESTPEPFEYHVTFIEERASRAWVPFWDLRQFNDQDVATSQGAVPNQYRRSIERSVRTASELAKLSLKNRIEQYSFNNRYNPRRDLILQLQMLEQTDDRDSDTSPEWKCSDVATETEDADDEREENADEHTKRNKVKRKPPPKGKNATSKDTESKSKKKKKKTKRPAQTADVDDNEKDQ
ncbi:zinc finger CW-type PWWP domain protein 1-like isoform X2 [Corticium candelabrum]|uniref:zinc finger CW-type PWWP domain protein 1-like isoform X2 n=1 Tax=Corticium candelabrum TaxID=121492 RepID=UPI002E26A61A|nr:zinc finger CW-type PWWP domain protein 1-like isoform X2 [Corticium candelabrum]